MSEVDDRSWSLRPVTKQWTGKKKPAGAALAKLAVVAREVFFVLWAEGAKHSSFHERLSHYK